MRFGAGIRRAGFAAAAVLLSCAAAVVTPPRGQVMMKIDATTAHVRMRDCEVSAGDHVRILRRECAQQGKGAPTCQDRPVGEGVVVQLFNAHDAVVRLAAGSEFVEGDEVEKLAPCPDGGPFTP